MKLANIRLLSVIVIVTDECRFNVELDYNANKLDCHCPQLCVSVSYLLRQSVSFYYLWLPCIAGCGHMYFHPVVSFLWSPYGIGQTIIFSSCFFILFVFPCLISAVEFKVQV